MLMNSFIVSYDLNNEKDYSKLIREIESYSNAAKINKSVWLINSHNNSSSIRDNLIAYIDNDDSLFVAKLNGEAAWRNALCSNDHLHNYL